MANYLKIILAYSDRAFVVGEELYTTPAFKKKEADLNIFGAQAGKLKKAAPHLAYHTAEDQELEWLELHAGEHAYDYDIVFDYHFLKTNAKSYSEYLDKKLEAFGLLKDMKAVANFARDYLTKYSRYIKPMPPEELLTFVVSVAADTLAYGIQEKARVVEYIEGILEKPYRRKTHPVEWEEQDPERRFYLKEGGSNA